MELLINIALVSLFCLGWRTITSDGAILNFLRKPFENVTSGYARYVLNPIILCVKCMPSFWGTLVYLTLNHYEAFIHLEFGLLDADDWLLLIVCIISSSFVSAYAWNKYE